ncbi:MAG: pyrroline-5-carboxylate reductase [Clostridia bacterium]|nr:pyrroline-5-carboxylate reductase [Clostridia bacterium]
MKIGFIGAGNMGSAIAKATAKSAEIYVYDIDESKAASLAESVSGKTSSVSEMTELCDYLFIAVKPNFVKDVIETINKASVKDGLTLVSMAAGVSLKSLDEMTGGKLPVIRIMPNTPVAVGKGVVLTAGNSLITREKLLDFKAAMTGAGDVEIIDESLIDAGTALSGCSPAFVYMFIDALACGASDAGLNKDDALKYAAKTLIGAATLLIESEKAPDELRDAVCSKGGSTIEGVKSLMSDGFRETVMRAVLASYKRTLELGK